MIDVLLAYLFHLTGRGIVIGGRAAAFLSDLHGPRLEEAVPDWPLGHTASAVAADFHLDSNSRNDEDDIRIKLQSYISYI